MINLQFQSLFNSNEIDVGDVSTYNTTALWQAAVDNRPIKLEQNFKQFS
jgi:hypothetical protein